MFRTVTAWTLGMAAVLAAGMATGGEPGSAGFAFREAPGEHLDVLLDGRLAARYMTALDTSTPQRRFETAKPYLHLFDAEGRQAITNGPRGLFPHHRGIFIGWRKIDFQGKSYDLWGMRESAMIHRQFTDQKASGDRATFTSLVHWKPDATPVLLEERRTIGVQRAPAPARLLIEFTSTLTAVEGDVVLDGDPEHAGVQYRPAAEIDVTKTTYVFPGKEANPKAQVDLPWVGESYTLDGKRYSVVYLNHPQNPRPTKFSAYRDYGRFGGFFKHPLPRGQSLVVRYGFLLADGEMPPPAAVQQAWDRFAGAASASPVPEITLRPAEVSPPPKPRTAKPKAAEKPAATKPPAGGK